MRHGKKLGFTGPTLHTLVAVMAGEMGEAYPELARGRDAIARVVRSEEERFEAVLTNGLPRLEEALDRSAAGNKVLPGDEAFRLYDSLGVPLDFMEDLAEQRHLRVDREGFERAMEGQRERARAGSAFKAGDKALVLSMPAEWEQAFEQAGDSFAGYETTCVTGATIVGLFDTSGKASDELRDGTKGYIALSATPFYLEAGGQVSDDGRILGADGAVATVERLVRPAANRPRLHLVRVEAGRFRRGQIVTAEVADEIRDSTRRNHTATHLLHAALRKVLGAHVKQAGSLVAPDRLRFDFVHFSAVTPDEILEIERIVNAHIYRNLAVQTEVRTTEEAIAAGAMALFGEKYGDRVRVVSIPGFSLELCGGTHVRATGDIGFFAVTEESGVAAGVRRVEALTGAGAVEWAQRQRQTADGVLRALNVTAPQAVDAIQRLQAENKRLAREVDQLKVKAALSGSAARSSAGSASEGDDVQNVAGVKLITRHVSGLDKGGLRNVSDTLRDRLGSGVVVLASEQEGKVALVVSVSKDLTGRVQAGRLVKDLAPIVGGGGGGRPDFAEAGGRDASKIGELLRRAPELLQNLLG
jgi:alanyl-tRNA synthetase